MAVSIPEQAAPAPKTTSIEPQTSKEHMPILLPTEESATSATIPSSKADHGAVKAISVPAQAPTAIEEHKNLSVPADNGVKPTHIPQPTTIDTTTQPHHGAEVSSPVEIHGLHTAEFTGNVNTNNEIPSQETLNKIANISVLDRDGRSIPFKNIYSGPNVARRVLVIFIRHFFCGNCQEYIRTLTKSISPSTLLHLPVPTFIAIIGCGSPALIPMYQTETSCPFPIYADPTKALYDSLGMLRTLNMGGRPDYQRRGTLLGMVQSIGQGFKALTKGTALKAGDLQQVGGEFLFEPVDIATPISSPQDEQNKQLGSNTYGGGGLGVEGEEKHITWCHRMKNTRDHAEIPELREVLGLDGEGEAGGNKKRWTKALEQRKGTGLSVRSSGSLEKEGSSGRASSEKIMG